MLLSAYNRQAVILCLLLALGGITALAHTDNNNWSYKRSKNIVKRSARGQAGYRPAVGVSYQQQFPRNQTQWLGSSQNNRTQYNQPGYRPAVNKPQQPTYGQVAFNHTPPSLQQFPTPNQVQYPAVARPGNFNQSRTTWQQPQAPNRPPYVQHASPNQTRPSIANYPYQAQGNLNQTRPQPIAPIYPQINLQGQQTRPVWLQPSAPQLPNYPAQPTSSQKPVLTPNSWTYTANQTNLYPKLPTWNSPLGGNGASPPLASHIPQGPHNWHSGGQAALSYPVAGQNRNASTHQVNSNPYANMFN